MLALVAVEGFFEQRFGVGIGRDEQQDRRMHSVQASPRATNRMLKKSASFVLTSLRGSTYRSVRLASSLAAALLDSLFEHPAKYLQ